MDALVALTASACFLYSLFHVLTTFHWGMPSRSPTLFRVGGRYLDLITLGSATERPLSKGRTKKLSRNSCAPQPKEATVLRDGKEVKLPVDKGCSW